MLGDSIESEIKWQIAGREIHAGNEPRIFAYRVITVLGLEMSPVTIDTIEEQIFDLASVYEDSDDMDDGDAGWYFEGDHEGIDPNAYLDRYAYDNVASPPLPIEAPLTTQEEEERLDGILNINH